MNSVEAIQTLVEFLEKVPQATAIIDVEYPKYVVTIAWKDPNVRDILISGSYSKESFPEAVAIAVDTANRIYEESKNQPRTY